MKSRLAPALILATVLGHACYRSSGLGADAGGDGDTDADSDTGLDTGSDTGSDADTDADSDTGTEPVASSFVLPDTNQRDCLHPPEGYPDPWFGVVVDCDTIPPGDPVFGQDGHYLSPPRQPGFLDSGDGTVADGVTGLAWQRCPHGLAGPDCETGEAAADNWFAAEEACAGLDLGGFDDWRVPSRFELATLVDASRVEPAIDPEAFPNTPPEAFWSSTVQPPGPGAYYGTVDFGLGTLSGGSFPSSKRFARCVRGVKPVPGPFVASVAGEERVVEDQSTGLVWQGCLPGVTGGDCSGGAFVDFDWWSALSYCESLEFGGHDDWRVPDRNELMTLIDFSGASPFTDTEAFPGPLPASNQFWSSTFIPYDESVDMIWTAMFDNGVLQPSAWFDFAGSLVRCVRGGP